MTPPTSVPSATPCSPGSQPSVNTPTKSTSALSDCPTGNEGPAWSDAELLSTLRVPPDPVLSSQFGRPECQNIVSNVEWGVDLNLQHIPNEYACPESTPRRFAAVKIRIKHPSTTALIFKNGKVVCVGATTQECARLACQKHRRLISALGYRTQFKRFLIQNRVFTARVGHPISLNVIVDDSEVLVPGNQMAARWRPGQFPGLIYEVRRPNVKLTIFDSGKVIMTGVKPPGDAFATWDHIHPALSRLRDDQRPTESDSRYAYRMKKKLGGGGK